MGLGGGAYRCPGAVRSDGAAAARAVPRPGAYVDGGHRGDRADRGALRGVRRAVDGPASGAADCRRGDGGGDDSVGTRRGRLRGAVGGGADTPHPVVVATELTRLISLVPHSAARQCISPLAVASEPRVAMACSVATPDSLA